MSPQHIFIGASEDLVIPPIADTWFNRTQARADARATAAVDLDPFDTITGLNLWTSKPSAIGVNDPIDGIDKVLVAARGSLALLRDDGSPGDPIIIDDGWNLIEADCRWNQLVKTGPNTATYFMYGSGGPGYPFLGANIQAGTSAAYFKGQQVSISGGNIVLVGTKRPLAGTPTWDFRVPTHVVRYKAIIHHVTGDIFALQADGFSSIWRMQLFSFGAFDNSGNFHTPTQIFGAESGVLYAGDISAGAELDSMHVAATNGLWQLTQVAANIPSLSFTSSGHLLAPGWAALNTKVGLALDQNGRVVNTHAGSTLLDFSIATGYTVADTSGGAQSGSGAEGEALDNASAGDPNPELAADRDTSRGGYAQRNIHSMEITGADEDFMQLATNKSSGLVARVSKALRVNGLTITAGVQILENVGNTDYNTVPFRGVLITDEYAKKDDDTIYGFYMKKVGGLLRPHGFIMRK